MKKRLCLFGLLLTLLVMLTACHGARDTSAFQLPETFDTTREYQITFWAKNDTNITQADIYRKAISDFEALYPNIHVDLKLYTDYGRIYQDVITNIATGTTPNVCITYPDHIATYMTGANCVVPLDALMDDSRYGLGGSEVRFDGPTRDEIVPQFLQECDFSGQHYALPYMRSTEACYVNRTYVEKLGFTLPETLTWDFIWEVSEAAMAKDEDGTFLVNGQKVMIPFIYKSTDNMMIQWLRQLDAGYSTLDGQVLLFNDTTRQILREIAPYAQSRAFSTFKISSYPANFLNAGQCIFAVDSTAGATWMGSDAPLVDIAEENLVRFDTEVMLIPQADPARPQMISQGPSMCVFNKEDPQEVLASWLFTQYMVTNEVQIPYACTEGYVPVTLKAQESAEYQDYLARAGEDGEEHYIIKLQATQLLLDNVENTFVTPVFSGSASLRDAAGQLIEETVKGARRKTTIDEAFIDEQFSKMTSMYSLNLEGGASNAEGKKSLGPLPATAWGLLLALGLTWVGILLYVLKEQIAKRNLLKKRQSH